MGGGSWTTSAYCTHSTKGRGFATMDAFLNADSQELYRATQLESALNPYGVIRECCDSEEHPNTIPVILALDVTGSMGSAAEAVAKQLNDIMSQLYSKVADVEFMTMAIGDLSYDRAAIQASQFESDIRIAEQLEKVWFEKGGGGNSWESYTAAWYFALHNTKLDCWKRGKKGIIITMGDEPLNPYLPKEPLERSLGCNLQGDVDTKELYKEVTKKFDVYHLGINDYRTNFSWWREKTESSWKDQLGQNYIETTCDGLYKTIADIIINHNSGVVTNATPAVEVSENGISW